MSIDGSSQTPWQGDDPPRFAVLQLSGCAGCEVSLLNAGQWIEQYKLVYMPLVISAYDVPQGETTPRPAILQP